MTSVPRLVLVVLFAAMATASSHARTLRLFVIGNSFSNNATHYLPQIAKEAGHELIMVKAEAGGCPLHRHWNALAADLAQPGTKEAQIYQKEPKSLRGLMGDKSWDVITIQQYSMLSGDPKTYQPFARDLCAYLRKAQPAAQIVMHQTWAYRVDAQEFGKYDGDTHAKTQKEMYEKSRGAYRQIAAELGIPVIPNGDAFWRVDTDAKWGFRPDTSFSAAHAKHPELPNQTHSLHVGYFWRADEKAPGKFTLVKDYNHANAAGEYLGALMWYGFLFNESPEKVTFVPAGVAPDFAAFLRKVAADVLRESAVPLRKAA